MSDSQGLAALTNIVEKARHYEVEELNDLPFKYLKQLGHGRSGVVDKVEDKDPDEGSVYARKNIYVRGLQKRKDEIRKAYQNEIKIVGKVKGHHHFVRLIATYTTTNPEAVGLILQPAADGGDLEHFLNRVRKPIENSRSGTQLLGDDSSILKQAFGCLAGGLAYMHQLGIRHKDIKPRNILVHEGCVTYADFGFSLDFSELQSSTTNNQPVVSKRYTAPEVLDREPRNSKSDVYALGCVYVDLLSTLTGAADIDDESEFPNDIERLQSQLEQMPVDPSMEFLADVCRTMIRKSPEDRPNAYDVFSKIQEHEDYLCLQCKLTTNSKGPFSLSRSATVGSIETSFVLDRMSTLKVEENQDRPGGITTSEPSISSFQATVSPAWTWSEPHQAYYYVTYNPENGEPVYQWHKPEVSQSLGEPHSIQQDGDYPAKYLQAGDGSYTAHSTPRSSGNRVDLSFRRRDGTEGRGFFRRGRVFAMLRVPPTIDKSAKGPKTSEVGSDVVSVVVDSLGERVSSQIHRFVIVSVDDTRVKACPVVTYSGRGTMDPSCVAAEHAVIYLSGTSPMPFEGEVKKGMDRDPIEVEPVDNGVTLQPASRIRFGRTYTIDRDVEVKEIGLVIPEHMERVIRYWGEEQGGVE